MIPFFFIPATKTDKISFIKDFKNVEIILDLEDSVPESKRQECLSILNKPQEDWLPFYVRVPLREDYTESIDLSLMESLINSGYRNFVLPKILNITDLEFLKTNKGIDKVILLIEHPKLLFHLPAVLDQYDSIVGVGLGSHDLFNVMGAHHEFKNLEYYRLNLNLMAKAYGIMSIDFASTNIQNEEICMFETRDGIEKGYDGKFIIHPFQFHVLKKIEEEIKSIDLMKSRKIIEIVSGKPTGLKYEPFILNGTVIEKPHILKAEDILKNHGK